jgi:hypothetical protein
MFATQKTLDTRRGFAYGLAGLLFILAILWSWTQMLYAQGISYDPYADSVAGTALLVQDANNAVGAPNGTTASMAGPGASLTLDMGAGEEGTQSLRVYLGQINLQVNIDVAFLDGNQAVIRNENRQLGIDPNPSVQNFAYNWTQFGKAYRYVRISSMVGGGVNVDAIEALGYIGSSPTQDTDGDGRPDRSEQQNGTNPLVPDPPQAGSSTPTGPIPGPRGGGGAGGASAQVNTPPATNGDQDGDGMADDWERAHGLDPTNAGDADDDPDHDGLKNLTEFKINSDPQKLDTDGDGMPDKWEYEHGLDINRNDADEDPDGDHLTNLGEYRHNTDPNKADDLYDVFGTDCTIKDVAVWKWLVLGLLVGGGLGFAASAYRGKNTGSKKAKKARK